MVHDGDGQRASGHGELMVAGMVLTLTMGGPGQGLQWPVLVPRGVVSLQGSRDGQGWTWSKPIFSMGTDLVMTCKVFDVMPARE